MGGRSYAGDGYNNGIGDAGDSYVVFGSASSPASSINLSTLDGSNGFALYGAASSDQAGWSVSSAGDINNDGYADILVSARYGDGFNNSVGNAGDNYVIFGQETFTAYTNLSSLNGSNGFTLYGMGSSDYAGYSVSSAGDVNGDGYADLLIGAERGDTNATDAGETYLIFGKAAGYSASMNLENMVWNGEDGIIVNGITTSDYSGHSVSGAGDVNGDGYDDFLIGAYYYDAEGISNAGGTYLIYGKADGYTDINLSDLDGSNGFLINGIDSSDYSGYSVSSAGDINNDGFADLLIGAYLGDPNAVSDSGESYVIYGQDFKNEITYLGTSGSDTFTGTSAAELITTYAGDDTITGSGGDDRILAGEGNNTVTTTSGNDFINTGSGIDSINAGDGNNVIVSGSGNDTITTGTGHDTINAGAGNDTIQASDGNNVLNGGQGDDSLTAGSGGDILNGGSGTDTLNGGGGNDTLRGGGGNDTLDGGTGRDAIYGGVGDDVLVYDAADTITVDGGVGNDTLQISGSGISLDLVTLDSTLITNFEIIDLTGNGNNSLNLDSASLLSHSETTTLRIDGNAGDVVTTEESGWSFAITTNINGNSYKEYHKDTVTLQVAAAIDTSKIQTSMYRLSELDGELGFTLNGTLASDQAGWSVSDAGDINGDGYGDFLIGARYANPNSIGDAGATYLVFGQAAAFNSSINLSSLDGSNGFVLNGIDASDQSAWSVSGAGDVNNDGYADIVIGARLGDLTTTDAGETYVVYGHTGAFSSFLNLSSLNGSNGFSINGIEIYDHAGSAVSDAGDVNGDGYADILIGAPDADGLNNGGTYTGDSYVVFGAANPGTTINLSSLNGSNGFVLYGINASDYAGYSVSSAGDINNDGYSDLLIGARYGDALNNTIGNAGESYVVFGQATFTASIDLSSLNGSNGFTLYGIDSSDYSGFAISNAGDVNGDGYADILIGAYAADPNGTDSGEAYLVFGKASGFSSSLNLSSLDGSNGFVINGIAASDITGYSVSGAGDFDNDGYDDFLVGVHYLDVDGVVNAGGAALIYGKASGHTDLNLADLDGSDGFFINGIDSSDYAGHAVSSAGDINNDGFADLLIGAYLGDPNGIGDAGETYVIYGHNVRGDNSIPNTVTLVDGGAGSDTLQISGAAGSYELSAISSAQFSNYGIVDLTGTGNNSLNLDAATLLTYGENATVRIDGNSGDVVTTNSSGWSYAISTTLNGNSYYEYHKDTVTLQVSTDIDVSGIQESMLRFDELNGELGFTLNGTDASDQAGWAVSDAGDINADGYGDFLVGARYGDANANGVTNAGETYLIFGQATAFASSINLSSLNGSNGFVLNGINTSDYAGYSVSSAGDFNQDGYDDIIIGAYASDPYGSASGESYIVFGKASGFSSFVNLSALNGSDGFVLNGIGLDDYSGFAVSGAGDVNGDGYADVLIGAYLGDPSGADSGESYVVFGSSTSTASFNLSTLNGSNGLIINGITAADHAGFSVSSAGDLNNDGYDDMLIGARYGDAYNNSATNAGDSYVVFGQATFTSPISLANLDGSNGFTIYGIDTSDYAGFDISNAGDVNGDGHVDILIGAYAADPNGADSGEAYLLLGKPEGFNRSINLAQLAVDGSDGIVIYGIAAGDNTGRAVSSAGDFNGDGYDDLLIGAHNYDAEGISNAGGAYLIYGKADGYANLELSSLDGSDGFSLYGNNASDYAGIAVSSAGDINHDGFADIIIGAYAGDPNAVGDAGEAFVIYGHDSRSDITHLGTSSIDSLTGSTADEIFQTGSGNDTIVGAGGDDRVMSGDGDDTITSTGGDDQIKAGAGNDSISTGDGDDIIDAESGNDTVNAGLGADLVKGGDGDDTLNGEAGDDQLLGGRGVDNLNGGSGADTLLGGAGNDILDGSTGGDILKGGAGDDQITYDATDSVIDGGLGSADTLTVSGAAETVDLTTLSSTLITGIEIIDLTGTGNNSFNLDSSQLLARSSSATMRIDGNAGDTVTTSDSGWSYGISVSINGNSYQEYHKDSVTLQVAAAVEKSGVQSSMFRLSELDGELGFVLNGTDSSDQAGWSVSEAGDINADGYGDFLIGARYGDANAVTNAGETYLVFGQAAAFNSSINLSSLNGTDGFVLNGISSSDYAGFSTSEAGDVNNDGYDDILIGAYYGDASGTDTGETYVVYGHSGVYTSSLNLSSLNGSNGFVLNGVNTSDISGYSVSDAGDVNGDGYADIVIGAHYGEGFNNSVSNAGESYVVFGSATPAASFNLSSLDGSNGFVLNGIGSSDYAGWSVSSAGDINQDGYDDVLIGAQYGDGYNNSIGDAGESYVIFGQEEFSAYTNLSSLDGSNGFTLYGIGGSDYTGYSVSDAGDINGDGYADILIGAERGDTNGGDSGETYLLFGKADGYRASWNLANMAIDGSDGIVINGVAASDFSGRSVSGAGDFNGDGYDDILIGAYQHDAEGVSNSGGSFLIYGKADGYVNLNLSDLDGSNGFRINGVSASDYSGQSVSSAGDINQDGFADIIIGAYAGDPNAIGDAGEAYVIYGQDFRNEITFVGSTGNDTVTGTSGAELMTTYGGDDNITGNGGNDRILAGDGNNSITTTSGDDRIESGSGIDTINAGDGNNVINSGSGNDSLTTGAGDDNLNAGPGNDTLNSGEGDNVLNGGSGDDSLTSGSGTDTLNGGSGNDTLNAGDGNDILRGGGGQDTLVGAGGNDRLYGGAGDDVLTYDAADTITVDGGTGSDTLQVSAAGITVDLLSMDSTLITNMEVIDLTGSGNNTLNLDATTLLAHSENATLRIDGNSGDVVTTADGGWSYAITTSINGGSYREYHKDTVTLQVASDITVTGIQTSMYRLDELNGELGFTLNGTDSSDHAGWSVSEAGDINADGFGDFLIGARYGDANGVTNAGETYLIFGQAAALASSINLSSLNGSDGFVLNGISSSDYAGFSVSEAGDVNNDGYDDILIGGYYGDTTGTDTGETYVVYGHAGSYSSFLNLSSLNGSNGFVLNGVNTSDISGYSVSNAGDVNGDGYADILIGAHYGEGFNNSVTNAGESYVVFGSATPAASFNLSTLDGSNGFVLNGIGSSDYAGWSVSSAGDINHDGYDDLLIGAQYGDGFNNSVGDAGESYVVFGQESYSSYINLSSLDGSNGFTIYGIDSSDYAGYSVSDAGDVNGDGYGDMLIGVERGDTNGGDSGETYLLFGKAAGYGMALNLAQVAVDNQDGFVIRGVAASDFSGRSVSGAGDFNGDGYDDILIGAYQYDAEGISNSGGAYLIYGRADGYVNLNLSDLDGSNGFLINGNDASDYTGQAVSGAGDINHDGFADLIIGAYAGDPNAIGDAGEAFVIYGHDYRSDITYLGTSGDDALTGSSADEVFQGGDGNDIMVGGGGDDIMIGGDGDDSLTSSAGADHIKAGGGNDSINSSDGDDVIDAGAGNDTINAGLGADLVKGGAGDDTINGEEGNDQLLGGAGIDTLNGGAGDDTLVGGADNDILDGAGGNDILKGGAGNDQLIYDGNDITTIDGGSGSADTLTLSGSGTALDLTATAAQISGIEIIDLTGSGNNSLTLDSSQLLASSSSGTMRIDGDYGDIFSTSDSGWSFGLTVTLGGNSYQEYHKDTVTLQVAAAVDVSGVQSSMVRLSELNGELGFVLNGSDSSDHAGWSVSEAGDINADGYDDFLVGARYGDANAVTNAGETYLIFGQAAAFASSIDLSNLNGTDGFVLNGISSSDYAGYSMSQAGDVNNDGYGDLLIGAYYGDANGTDTGETYVVYGHSGVYSSFLNLSSLNGSNGFVLNGVNTSDISGYSVNDAGDVNGDGYADILIGAHYGEGFNNSVTNAGESYVVFGSATPAASFNLSSLNGSNGFVLNGIGSSDYAGWSVSGAGDINNDGYSDIIIGAEYGDGLNNGVGDAGESYVIYGQSTFASSYINLSSLDGNNGFTLYGKDSSDYAGYSVSNAGDVNADGYADILIGAERGDPNGGDSGETYLIFGKASGFGASINLGNLVMDGVDGIIIQGVAASDFSGRSVSGVGDFDSDGYDDILIGAYQNDAEGVSNSGAAYLIYGKADGYSNLDLSSLDGSNGFVIHGIDSSDYTGQAVSGAGDINNDGYADLIIGAYAGDPNAVGDAGEAYVIYGHNDRYSESNTVTLSSNEDTDLVLTAGNFGYRAGDSLVSIQITTLESVGSLKHYSGTTWNDVTLNQVISKADIDLGYLKFVPVSHGNGNDYDSFAFTSNDGTSDSAIPHTISVDVTAVNDVPTLTSTTTGTIVENAATSTLVYTVTATDLDTEDSLSYSLSGTDMAAFAIDPITGAVTLLASADYETTSSYNINVTATDNGAGNLSATQSVVISVTDVVDPIILDLDGDGINLIASPDMDLSFAMSTHGNLLPTAWIEAGDGFLVMDKNHNQQVDDISELFSEFYTADQITGLEALSTLDVNHDAQIDRQDSEFGQLSIWQDVNQDGITDAGELNPLSAWGINTISLEVDTIKTPVDGGSVILSSGTFHYEDGSQGAFAEVGLGVDDASEAQMTSEPGENDLLFYDELLIPRGENSDGSHGVLNKILNRVLLTNQQDTVDLREQSANSLDVTEQIGELSVDMQDMLDMSTSVDQLLVAVTDQSVSMSGKDDSASMNNSDLVITANEQSSIYTDSYVSNHHTGIDMLLLDQAVNYVA